MHKCTYYILVRPIGKLQSLGKTLYRPLSKPIGLGFHQDLWVKTGLTACISVPNGRDSTSGYRKYRFKTRAYCNYKCKVIEQHRGSGVTGKVNNLVNMARSSNQETGLDSVYPSFNGKKAGIGEKHRKGVWRGYMPPIR